MKNRFLAVLTLAAGLAMCRNDDDNTNIVHPRSGKYLGGVHMPGQFIESKIVLCRKTSGRSTKDKQITAKNRLSLLSGSENGSTTLDMQHATVEAMGSQMSRMPLMPLIFMGR